MIKSTILKNGVKIYHHGGNDYIAGEIKRSHKYYEQDLLDLIFRKINLDSFDILEVGANIGNHVSYYINNLNVNKVTAYEPLKDNYEILQKNINSSVEVVKYGLGKKSGEFNFFINPDNFGASSISANYKTDNFREATIKIKPWNIVNKKKYNFIKVDIEGAEEDILNDIADTAINNKAYLLIECSLYNYKKIDTFISFFKKMISTGFKVEFLPGDMFFFSYNNSKRDITKNDMRKINKNFYGGKIWNIRSKYDVSKSKKELEKLKKEYQVILNEYNPTIKEKLFWSKAYRFFTHKIKK